MTEQRILVYKLFLSINIPDFRFFVQTLEPPLPAEKVTSLFPSNPPVKTDVLSSSLFENLVGGSKGSAGV